MDEHRESQSHCLLLPFSQVSINAISATFNTYPKTSHHIDYYSDTKGLSGTQLSFVSHRLPNKNTMLLKATAALLLLGRSLASPIDTDVQVIQERQSCPAIHLFGARETTVAPGYGTSATFINLVIQAHPGATEEAINYPACGGQASCGSVSYASSVVAGIQAVTSQVNSYNAMCPNTILILVGYSQVSSKQSGYVYDANVLTGRPNNGRCPLRRRRHQRRLHQHSRNPLRRRRKASSSSHLRRRPAPHPRPPLQCRHLPSLRLRAAPSRLHLSLSRQDPILLRQHRSLLL